MPRKILEYLFLCMIVYRFSTKALQLAKVRPGSGKTKVIIVCFNFNFLVKRYSTLEEHLKGIKN